MASHLIFLGTGGDSIVAGKQYRATGGIVFTHEGFQFVIDPGPGCLNMAKSHNVNLRDTSAIIATHNHVNHANDVNAVINALTHGGMDKHGVFIGNKTVVEGEDMHKPILSNVHMNYLERVITLRPDQRVNFDKVEMKGLRAYHSDYNTIGLKFSTPKFTLTYSSDTRFEADLLEEYAKSDVLILNVVYPFETAFNDQLNCENAVEIFQKVKPRLGIITHFGIKMLNADPMFQAREIQRKSGVQVMAARDGHDLDLMIVLRDR